MRLSFLSTLVVALAADGVIASSWFAKAGKFACSFLLAWSVLDAYEALLRAS